MILMWMYVSACVPRNNTIEAMFSSYSLVDCLKSFINESDKTKIDLTRPSMKGPDVSLQ